MRFVLRLAIIPKKRIKSETLPLPMVYLVKVSSLFAASYTPKWKTNKLLRTTRPIYLTASSTTPAVVSCSVRLQKRFVRNLSFLYPTFFPKLRWNVKRVCSLVPSLKRNRHARLFYEHYETTTTFFVCGCPTCLCMHDLYKNGWYMRI